MEINYTPGTYHITIPLADYYDLLEAIDRIVTPNPEEITCADCREVIDRLIPEKLEIQEWARERRLNRESHSNHSQ